MAIGPMAAQIIREGWGREITQTEALELQRQNQQEGFAIQTQNSQSPEFFCACCGCCCGILEMGKFFPRPVDFIKNNTHAVLNQEVCIGCGKCAKKCPMDAIRLVESTSNRKLAEINPNRCIGCGVCVQQCPKKAIRLEKNRQEHTPPQDHGTLYQTIREHRPSRLHKYWRLIKAKVGKKISDPIWNIEN